MENKTIETLRLRKIVKNIQLKEGDQFFVSGYTNNKNIQSDMHKLREEFDIDMKISQKQFLLIDTERLSNPENFQVAICWLITVTKGSNIKIINEIKEKEFKKYTKKIK